MICMPFRLRFTSGATPANILLNIWHTVALLCNPVTVPCFIHKIPLCKSMVRNMISVGLNIKLLVKINHYIFALFLYFS